MNISYESIDNKTIIYLADRFDFSYVDNFQDSYKSSDSKKYIVDFKDTEYMDSSGLGMLLNMKRFVGDAEIDLVNCRPQIRKVLIISRFDSHFSIH